MSLWHRVPPEEQHWALVLESSFRSLSERQEALVGLADRGKLDAPDKLMVPWPQRLIRADRHPTGHPHTRALLADLVARGQSLDEIWTDPQGISHTAVRWAIAQGQSANLQALLELGASPSGVDARGKTLSWLGLALQSPLEKTPALREPGPLIEALVLPLLAHGASPETGSRLSTHLQTLTRMHPIFHAKSKVEAATVERVLDAFLDARVRLDWPMSSFYGEDIRRVLTVATASQVARMVPQLPLDVPQPEGPTLREVLAGDPRLQAALRQADLTDRPAPGRTRARRRS